MIIIISFLVIPKVLKQHLKILSSLERFMNFSAILFNFVTFYNTSVNFNDNAKIFLILIGTYVKIISNILFKFQSLKSINIL